MMYGVFTRRLALHFLLLLCILAYTDLSVQAALVVVDTTPMGGENNNENGGGDGHTADGDYSWEKAWMGLHYSKASYCDPDRVKNWTCGTACTELHSFVPYNTYINESYSTFGYSGIDHKQKRIVFAFRGSTRTTNWIEDLKFWPIQYPNLDCTGNCTVHRGFYASYESIRDSVLADAKALHAKNSKYSFFVTGHSLGGALAILCALDFSTLSKAEVGEDAVAMKAQVGRGYHLAPLELYTFGVPRVGNSNFTAWSTSVLAYAKQYRLTHAHDPVPHLPPRSWKYVHVPQELWFPNGTEMMYYCVDSATEEDPQCSNSVWATVVSDHLIYLDVCTHCECTQADMAEIYSYELDAETKQLLADEYLPSRRESHGSERERDRGTRRFEAILP